MPEDLEEKAKEAAADIAKFALGIYPEHKHYNVVCDRLAFGLVEFTREYIKALEAERDRYRQALDFYADEHNYDDSGTPGKAYSIDYGDYGTDWDLDPDFGQRARDALGREEGDDA